VLGASVAVATGVVGGAPTPSPSPSPSPSPTLEPTPIPSPSPAPTVPPVAAVTNGVWLYWPNTDLATRTPIAVMIDDHAGARPQSGLSQADIVYQAPAESGVPRYLAIFQTQDPPLIGPIRSSRFYFVNWAEEWRPLYVHIWGSPNAMSYLYQINGLTVWNADGLRWDGTQYMYRAPGKMGPHNLYSTSAKLRALAVRLGATKPFTRQNWIFTDAAPIELRPVGGTISVPYDLNHVTYKYDRETNTYLRSVDREGPQIDEGNGRRVAPTNVVVLYQPMGLLVGGRKGRLDVDCVGTGRAVIFQNGTMIEGRWSKKSNSDPTVLTYASGPRKGKVVPLVRGQIFVQVVPLEMVVTWTGGRTPPPDYEH
jgi:hypothetical protein